MPLEEIRYNRSKTVAYARKWAFSRNPEYHSFDSLGGDCTNFVSQCIFAGCGVMNYTADTGWYYISLNNRAAAWTGVEYLAKFLLTNTSYGPYAVQAELSQAQPGDVIQLSFDGERYGHSLLVLTTSSNPSDITIAAHTFNSLDRKLGTYTYKSARLLSIVAARRTVTARRT